MPDFRADHVGSLLRPPELLEAHRAFEQGQLTAEALAQVEDQAIDAAFDLQKQAGLPIFSDGEYRRSTWAGDFADAVDGYISGEPPVVLHWRGITGVPRGEAPTTTGGRIIGERLRQARRLTAHESAYLKDHAPGPYKVTMPSPSYVVARGYKPGVTDKVYNSRAELLGQVSAILQAEARALVEEGVRYIQIDNPHYPDYIDPLRRQQWTDMGVDPDTALDEDIVADNAVLTGFDRSGVILAMHICRGNGGQAGWHTEGSYEQIAERVFGSVNVDRWLLEYDSDRAGGFEPLRFMPKGKTVVLGLVTTKAGALENQDDILKRIDEASRYVAAEDLALSPQCGFASVMAGNPLSPEEQRRKLALVVDTATKVWGSV
ncbi:MAG: hypothetical protein GEU75_09130 [Dehalococcoidia bacterium]|nr:hypothetical protein [Dehalococcoidia bacterium]